ncbi:ead/Ea22-like family protein [Klebsiella quasipneumoniae]|uniref:ead/Ea22-like family protein n=1 Tax=Klebsiella quasipneumoniae TaxID=1463165 RepID=UPI002875CA69|nr:ead/Ea22-like family protein [Klebsiella quasipneumoniae]MDS0272041.1 ead/Ea22-like family protein [Klebsiella quasipneumoniae]
MNIETVNELIQSLESAGELSIRETKVVALAKAYQQLAAENVALKNLARGWANATDDRLFEEFGEISHDSIDDCEAELKIICPATDRIVAGIKADGRVEGAHFVANRMLAAWDAGFIEDTAKNAADIARMILTSTEFMADAPEGDFDRSFADGILEDIAQQLREGADK